MLGSITPLGERGRAQRWWLTVGAFVLGSAAGGGTMGVVLGAAGALTPFPAPARLPALVVLGIVGMAFDLRVAGMRLPGPTRQVNEDWLIRYRGWVYGASFGFQLGLGVATVVSASSVYLALAAAFLSGSPAAGALIGATFGIVRAVPVLALRGVRSPQRLLEVERRLRRLDAPSRGVALACQSLLVVVAGALAGLL